MDGGDTSVRSGANPRSFRKLVPSPSFARGAKALRLRQGRAKVATPVRSNSSFKNLAQAQWGTGYVLAAAAAIRPVGASNHSSRDQDASGRSEQSYGGGSNYGYEEDEQSVHSQQSFSGGSSFLVEHSFAMGGRNDLSIQELRAGDFFGADAFVSQDASSAPELARSDFVPMYTVRVVAAPLRCLVFDAVACGPLYERMLRVFSRERASWDWAVANRNPLPFQHLNIGETIGRGSFGTVKLAVHSEGGVVSAKHSTAYALKCISRKALPTSQHVTSLLRERELLRTCSHPLVLRCAAAYQSSSMLYLLLDLELGGELFTLMAQRGKLLPSWARFYSGCVLSALAYFDSIPIAHRDIKSENLLLDSRGYLKVIDLGFARVVPEHGRCFSFCGTPEYMAPELLLANPHNQAVDCWAFGVLLYEMLRGHTPFVPWKPWERCFGVHGGSVQIMNRIIEYSKRGDAQDLLMPLLLCDQNAASLCRSLLISSVSKRAGPHACFEHAFMAGIDILSIEQGDVPAPLVPTIRGNQDTSNFDGGDADDWRSSSAFSMMSAYSSGNSEAASGAFDTLPGFINISYDEHDA